MRNIFRYLKTYSTQPFEVDRLIVSAFLEINHLTVLENRFLLEYSIYENQIQEWASLARFIEIINEEIENFDIEKLIELFEFVISPSDRIINGAIYTPSEIRDYIVSQTLRNDANILNEVTIADISCGCAGFLYTAVKELRRRTRNTYQHIFQNQIFGLDIQEYSVLRSKLLLSLLALSDGEDVEELHFNLHQGDALLFKWEDHYPDFDGFQIIVGNPPYVSARNLDEKAKENVKFWEVCSTGNPDLYIPFFQIGYENLSSNGILGFITMNTFFKSLNGRALRSYFERNNTSIKIIDFGTQQVFKSKSTYTCICILEKMTQHFVQYYKSVNKELPENINEYNKINYHNLNAKTGWNLHKNKIISKIEATGTPFGEIYKTRHGIATLKNDIYIFRPVAEDDDYFYLQNGSLYAIEKGICRDILNSNKLSRSIDFENIKEKVLFPYNNEKKPKILDEELLQDKYPKAFEYLNKKRNILADRDKGNRNYEKWFAFGRTQSLEKIENKLFFPKYSDQNPHFLSSNDEDLLFYNGQAIVGHTEEEMLIIQKIMKSKIFWHYIENTSKPYNAEYYSLNGTYIKNFGICDLNTDEKQFVLNSNDMKNLNDFFADKYEVEF